MRILYTCLFWLTVQTLPAQTAPDWIAEGKKAQAEKNHEKAIEWFERAETMDPKNPELHADMSLSFIQLGKYNKAISHAKSAQKIAPTEAKYVYYHAVALDSLKLDAQVLDVTNKALKLKSQISDLYVLRANIFLRKKEYNTTIANLNKAIELDDKNANAYFKRAYARLRVVDSFGACADWRKALALGIKDAQIFINAHCKD